MIKRPENNIDESVRKAESEKKEKESGEFYDRIRRRIVEEDNLINHRMMWGTFAQTALFAGFGIANFGQLNALRRLVSNGIGVVGLMTAVVLLISVFAARTEIRNLRNLYRRETRETRRYGELIIPLVAEGKLHSLGHALSIGLPALIILLWLWVLVAIYLGPK